MRAQAMIQLFDRILVAVSLYATSVLLARVYGPAAYGLYLTVAAVLQVAVGTGAAGAEVTFVRAYLRAPLGRRSPVVRAYLRWLLVAAGGAGLAFAMAGLLWMRSGSGQAGVMLLISAIGLLQLPLMVSEWRLRAVARIQVVAALRLPVTAAALAVKIGVALLGLSLVGLYAVLMVETLLLGLLLLAGSLRDARGGAEPSLPAPGRALMLESLRIAAAAVFVVAFFRLNILIIAAVSGLDEAGKYGAVLTIVLGFDLITGAIAATAFPHLLRTANQPGEVLPRLLRLGKVYSLLAAGFALAMLLCGRQVLEVVYGATYEDAYPALAILAFLPLFTSSAALRALYINYQGAAHLHMKNALIGICVLVPSSVVLSGAHGAVGAAGALVAGSLVSGVMTSFLFSETRDVGRVQLLSFVPRLGAR